MVQRLKWQSNIIVADEESPKLEISGTLVQPRKGRWVLMMVIDGINTDYRQHFEDRHFRNKSVAAAKDWALQELRLCAAATLKQKVDRVRLDADGWTDISD